MPKETYGLQYVLLLSIAATGHDMYGGQEQRAITAKSALCSSLSD